MGAKKVEIQNEGTLFDELTQEIKKDHDPIDLQSKAIQFEAKRNSKRESFKCTVTIFDLQDKVITKAALKDLSPDGVRFEILPIDIQANDEVYIQFSFAINLGMILCTVQWVADITGRRKNHKLIGLKFKNLTPRMRKQLSEFLVRLKTKKSNDPFYVG